MYRNNKISLIIPCFNEEEGIKTILRRRPLFIDQVIVVDNNSTDKTSEVAEKLGAQVILEKRRGYGQAYLTGFRAAQGDILVTMDGDNSYPVEEISNLIDVLLNEEADFISGRRFPLQQKQSMGFLNRLGNFILTLFFLVLTFKKIRDSLSGMWVFKKRVLSKIRLKSKGMPLSPEIKMEAILNKNIKFKEVPIGYLERIGQVKLNRWKDGLMILLFLFKKRIELILR